MFSLAQVKQIQLNKFGGLFTEADPRQLPAGASPQCWDIDFNIAEVGTRAGLSNPVTSGTFTTPPIQYLKSAAVLNEQIGAKNFTLAQDSGTTLYSENLTSSGAFSALYSNIINNARALSATVDQTEYIALSNFIMGMDQPRTYDGQDFDRISQVGPGAGPTISANSNEYVVSSVSQIWSAVQVPNASWGASINLNNAQPSATTLYLLGPASNTTFTNGLAVGDLIYISGGWSAGGVSPNGTYAITLLSTYTDGGGTYQVIGVTTSQAASGFIRGNGYSTYGLTFQKTEALVEMADAWPASGALPFTDVTVGGGISIQGATIPNANPGSWNGSWTIKKTPTTGYLTITATAISGGVITYTYTIQSGNPPGWQANTVYDTGTQIVSPAGQVWQVLAVPPSIIGGPGTSGGSIPSQFNSTQSPGTNVTDGGVTWTLQTGYALVATVFGTGNGNGIANVQNATITTASQVTGNSGTFTVATSSGFTGSAQEAGSAATGNNLFLVIDPGAQTLGTQVNPIYGTSSGGDVLVTNPLVTAGPRWAVLMFLTRDGYITPASPPVSFDTSASTSGLTFSTLPLGPANVIARIVAFTLANAGAGGPYYWIPDDVQIAGSASTLGVAQTFNKTVLDDNTSTSLGPLTISDAVLSASESISVTGNNLQNQRELGECVKVVQYAGRCFYLGERTKNDQFVNLTFDGGTIGGFPAGWGIYSPGGFSSHVSVVTSPIFGQSLQLTGFNSGSSLIIEFYSNSLSTTWQAAVPISSMSGTMQEFVVPFNNPLWAEVPDDLQFLILVSNIASSGNLYQSAYQTAGLLAPIVQPNTAYSVRVTCAVSGGNTVTVDRIEVFPTGQPVYNLQVAASYGENYQAIDGVTGAIDTSLLSSDPETNHFVFLNKYFITTKSKTLSPIQSATGEPDGWTVDEISNAVGCVGPLGTDVGEEYVIVADQNGVYVFDGGNHMKITQEIQQIWDAIYQPSLNKIWVLNDLKAQRILVGIPLPTPNQWLPNAPSNSTPATPNVILMCSYLGLMNGAEIAGGHAVFPSAFTGNLLFHDMKRKWTFWQIPATCGSWITRPNGGEQIWFGQTGISYLDGSNKTDNGSLIASRYMSYGFGDSQDREQKQLGLARVQLPYALVNIEGSGQFELTLLPETINTTYPATQPPFNLADPALDDVNCPLNTTGNRAFLQFDTYPTAGNWWSMKRIDLAIQDDPRMLVTGQ